MDTDTRHISVSSDNGNVGSRSGSISNPNSTLFVQQQDAPGFQTTVRSSETGIGVKEQILYSATTTTTTSTDSQQAPPAFFHQETLDMSHEDIQQTLSANMIDSGADLEPMSPSADDVFVNLDAFDILADLSEDFEQHTHNHGLHADKSTIVDINPEWAYTEVSRQLISKQPRTGLCFLTEWVIQEK